MSRKATRREEGGLPKGNVAKITANLSNFPFLSETLEHFQKDLHNLNSILITLILTQEGGFQKDNDWLRRGRGVKILKKWPRVILLLQHKCKYVSILVT